MWLFTYPLPIPTSRRPELALPQRSGPVPHSCASPALRLSMDTSMNSSRYWFQSSSRSVSQAESQAWFHLDGILPSHSVVTRLYIIYHPGTLEPGSSTSLFLSLKPFKNPKLRPLRQEKLFHTWKKLATSHITLSIGKRLYCSLLIATFWSRQISVLSFYWRGNWGPEGW